MKISQLVRSMLGEAQLSDAKSLELKVGQVVRGKVLQLLGDGEALVNIAGLTVRAKLETSLNQGQITMLQVQAESSNGQIVLKPIGVSTVPIADVSLVELLHQLGLKDQATHRLMLQHMHQEQIELNPSNVQQFKQVLAVQPMGVSEEEWLSTATVVFKRGLPLIEQTVRNVHQSLYGQPLHQALHQLRVQGAALLQAADSSLPLADKQTISLLLQVISQIQAVSMAGLEPSSGNRPVATTAQSVLVEGTGIAASPASTGAQGMTVVAGSTALPVVTASNPFESAHVAANAPNNPSSLIGASDSGVMGRNPLPSSAATVTAPSASPAVPVTSASTAQSAAEHTQLLQQPSVVSANPDHNAGATPRNQAEGEPSWIVELLKSLGLEHERKLASFAARSSVDHTGKQSLSSVPTQVEQLDNLLNPTARNHSSMHDSLKSLLMQLIASDGIPPAVREAMQQTLQQITGQQLLMLPDRNSMFSHITIMIPLTNENGDQTATIHMQSHKGKHGEIDANNCRLWFDLQMSTLGDTVVDVQVVNRMVSLQLLNDHPYIAQLVELNRDEIVTAISNVGYQMISMKCQPFPPNEHDDEQQGEDLSVSKHLKSKVSSKYNSDPYRGVDIRV